MLFQLLMLINNQTKSIKQVKLEMKKFTNTDL